MCKSIKFYLNNHVFFCPFLCGILDNLTIFAKLLRYNAYGNCATTQTLSNQ